MDLGLEGRIAFITGANRGIGETIAVALADEGVNLVIFGRNLPSCMEVAEKLKARGRGVRTSAFRLDFEDRRSIKPAVDAAASKMGGVDILINCAGGAYRGTLNDIPDDEWERYFAVKPLGLIRMTRETLPYLKKSSQARVINISGTRGREPEKFSSMSGPINFSALSATKAMANEFGPLGITVNAICPGSTKTRRWDELVRMTMEDQGISEKAATKVLLSGVPLGQIITPENIAALTVFLASARAAQITGCSINIDGGRTRSI